MDALTQRVTFVRNEAEGLQDYLGPCHQPPGTTRACVQGGISWFRGAECSNGGWYLQSS